MPSTSQSWILRMLFFFFAFLSIPNPQSPLPLSGGAWEQGRSYNFAGLDYHKGLGTALIFWGLPWGENLRELTLTNSNLIQYVDDFLIARPDFTSSQMDTIKTSHFLCEKGY